MVPLVTVLSSPQSIPPACPADGSVSQHLGTLTLLAQPHANAAFHLTRSGGDTFRWLKTDQYPHVNSIRRDVEKVNPIRLQ